MKFYSRVAAMLFVTASAVSGSSKIQEFSDFTTPMPAPQGSLLIIGFVGGWERWDNETRCVRKLALELRGANLPRTWVETVENHKRYLALQLVRRAFDTNGDGILDLQEKKQARVILYGQSFGGPAVHAFARELAEMNMGVMLAVQIDSIGHHDKVVAINIAKAANFFQRDGWPIRGEKNFKAEDPARTEILGNWQYRYSGKQIDISNDPWTRRTFATSHSKMEYDPEVWAKVKQVILSVAAPSQKQ